MTVSMPSVVLGFREGLEAFLVIGILLRFLQRSGRMELLRYPWLGAFLGGLLSAGFGLLLFLLADVLGGAGRAAKLWESAASLAALAFVSTFIIWMIRHGADLKRAVERQASQGLSGAAITMLALVMTLREGVEIALFSFAGTYSIAGLAVGILGAMVLVVLVFLSLVRVNLATIFNLTLAYLILQAGFLLGYGLHEGLSALKEIGVLAGNSPLLAKAYDLSSTALDHKQGSLGLPLYALVGWYSRPEWLQLAAHTTYLAGMFAYWSTRKVRPNQSAIPAQAS